MSEYTVSGRFQSRDGWQEFETEIDAENESVAEEHVLAEMGSRHNRNRRQIEVEGVESQ